MSKYRFKTKEEFIRDGWWDEERGCPIYWNTERGMNKYLGVDVPDEFTKYCDKNTSFSYNDCHFKEVDYVLKEQQEYFDDLSQHIGRYIKALVDNPSSGHSVRRGDVGKIISNCQADFPNRKSYYCICALSENHLGVKYELLPEDYSLEQEDVPERISFYVKYTEEFTENLYNALWEWSKKNSEFPPRDYADSYEGLKRNKFYVFDSWTLGSQGKKYGGEFAKKHSYGVDNNRQNCEKEYTIEQVKKLIGYKEPMIEFIPGKWYNFTTMKGKYNLYAKVASVTDRYLFFVNGKSISNGYFGGADCIQLKLIENPRLVEDLSEIQKYLPNEHPDKITSDVFKKGEYIVLIGDGQSTTGARLIQDSEQFIKNHCYKVRENNTFLRAELDSSESTTNGWECIPYNPNQFHKTRNWRYATEEESIEYERRGEPYNVTELQKKETFPEYGCVVITDNPINLVNYLQNSNRKSSSNNNYDKEKTILAWNNGSYWFCSIGSSKTKYSKDFIERIIGQSIYSDSLLENKKELSMREIQEECKKKYPIGCTFIPVGSRESRVLKEDSSTYYIYGNMIYAYGGGGCLYSDGKWAELVSLPEEEPKKFEKPDVLYHSKSTIKVVKKITKIKKPLAINSISINAIKK